VADLEACIAGVAKVEAELGPVEVIVNNAGITRDGTMKKMTRTAWDEVMHTNLGGCYNMCKAVWDGMNERKFGRIVNIGSINGQAGQYGQVNYAAAKSGIHGFTKALAKIVARIPVGRLGKADEIARGVLFLVADEAGFVTGSTMSINGGQHMY
jgi:acetoacetyl-CoA reductase